MLRIYLEAFSYQKDSGLGAIGNGPGARFKMKEAALAWLEDMFLAPAL